MAGRVALALVVASCLLAHGSVARADESGGERTANARRPGAWALEFGIEDNLRLTSFGSDMVALKRQTSERTAWRLGLSASLLADETDRSREYAIPDTTHLSTFERSGRSFGVNLTRLQYLQPARRATAYWGAGVFATNTHSRIESGLDGSAGVRMNSNQTSAGARVLFGGEWFAVRSIGIHAEYGARLQYRKATTEDAYPGSPLAASYRSETSNWSGSGSGVRFGASWYF
jgi:hypothetical protein